MKSSLSSLSYPAQNQLQEFGLDLEQDSEDFTQEECERALTTSSENEWATQVAGLIRAASATRLGPVGLSYALRRYAGILYCRVSVEGEVTTFRTDWMTS